MYKQLKSSLNPPTPNNEFIYAREMNAAATSDAHMELNTSLTCKTKMKFARAHLNNWITR